MPKKTPTYLRLHVGDAPNREPAEPAEIPAVESLCESFERTVGWSLSVTSGGLNDATTVWSATIGESQPPNRIALQRSREADEAACLAAPLESARELATSIGRVLGELECTRTALWRREAELAAGVPVSPRGDEQAHLAERLEGVLKNGVELLGCDAAALYLLDEATSQLKLRASFGLPKNRLLEPPRALRGAVADLEALVGHAVVLEDTSLLPHWRCPEEYPSAACVPVSSPSMPLGTLWFFSSKKRDFDAVQTNLMETVAGRLAADLEREILLDEALDSKEMGRQFDAAAQWQAARLPRMSPLLDDWKLAGWTRPARRVARQFHDWGVLPDGLVAAHIGAGSGEPLAAALTAAALHSAVRSHSEYRHTSLQMMQRVNETLWSSSAGGQLADLFYVLVDPETGLADCCSTGPFTALVLRDGGFEPLAGNQAALGAALESEYSARSIQLNAGDALVVVRHDAAATDDAGASAPQASSLGKELRSQRDGSAEEILDAAIELIAAQDDDEQLEQSVLIVKRRA